MKKLIPLLLLLSACSTSKVENTPEPIPVKTEAIEIAPVDTTKTLTKIAFGSCQHQKKPQPIWTALINSHPDLYVSMGDTVYASRPEDQPMSEQYRLQAQVPEFKLMRAHIPMIATWDDHDAGENDGGADNPKLTDAKKDFLQFFPYDAKAIPADEKGVYHSFIFGKAPHRVQIILLDTRTYRSALEKNEHPKNPLEIYQPTKDTQKTMLGEQQWQWLEGELKKPAEVRLVISSIQFVAEDHGFEKWANFPHERTRFLDLLQKTKAKNVAILSGDRHMAEFSHMSWPGVGDINDVTSSGINRVASIQEEPNRHRLGNFFAHENFGLVTIDWNKKVLSFEIRDIKGAFVQEVHQKIELNHADIIKQRY